jgi:hypothetical protein
LVSANQGGQGPERERWCAFPEPLYRFERITALVAGRERHDLASLLAISYDTYDASAARLLPIWGPLLPDHPLKERLTRFAVDQRDRSMLALFHTLHQDVCLALLEDDLGFDAAQCFREWGGPALFQVQLDALLALERPEVVNQADLARWLAQAFERSLRVFREQKQVPVRLSFKHPLTDGKSPPWLGFDSAERELPGTPVSPFQCRSSLVAGETLVYAPSFHLAIDMSDDHVYYNLPGGASESRFGPGYGSGIDDWLEGRLSCLSDFARPALRKEGSRHE